MRRKEFEQKREVRDASQLRVGIVAARFNGDIVDQLLSSAGTALSEWQVHKEHLFIARTAGSFEVPVVALRLIRKEKLNALVALGCIVRGETKHDEYLARAVANGLMRVALDTGVPIGLGILTVNDLKQAKERINHGAHAAYAVLEAAFAV